MIASSPERTEKKPYFSFFFKRLQKKNRKGIWKRFGNSGFRWKTKFNWFVDGFLFKIVSALEAVVLVSALCLYYLCCGYDGRSTTTAIIDFVTTMVDGGDLETLCS
ncbi:hypothetical protein L6452_35931 [Arctium lappa]|uniref:Uncharacterized protein n=1 Tax=Arctium lappa TaxID=4217 RepID=A0ACB8Y725_ARCLA|nr:hypothetical protein L6452_35931 [Arctium lappa]